MSATIDRPGWKRVTLGELVNNNTISMGRGNVISKESIASSPGEYPVFSSSATGDGIIGYYSKFMFDDERISWSIDGGGRFFYHPKSRYSVTNVSGWIKVNNPVEITTRFLYIALDAEWQKKHFDYQTKAHPSVIEKEYSISYPTLDEQNEISNAIDSIDTHIAALQSLIAKYEAIKKATVNLLLEPKADWRTSTMGESFDLSRGVVISKNEIERRPGIYPVYSSQSVNDGVLGLIDSYRYDGEYITWTTDGANAGTVFYRHGKFNCTNVCGIAKARIPKMSPAFVALMIAQYAKSYVSYVGNPKLMSNIFAQILFSYPSASEQRKIAEKITAIDKVLADYKAQLEKARQLKAGMMSYFFG